MTTYITVLANPLGGILVGTGQNELFQGSRNVDRILGNGGNDLLNGNLGNDWLYGGDGDDELYGGSKTFAFSNDGNDYLDGGDGNDWLSGGTGLDTLLGGTGNDSLFGGTGNDRLFGGTGNDYLDGGNENDYLLGEDGRDNLLGGSGSDILVGGAESDDLTGGMGNDWFVYRSTTEWGDEATFDGNNFPVTRGITDFSRGQNDKVVLRAADIPGVNLTFPLTSPGQAIAGQVFPRNTQFYRLDKVDFGVYQTLADATTARDASLVVVSSAYDPINGGISTSPPDVPPALYYINTGTGDSQLIASFSNNVIPGLSDFTSTATFINDILLYV